MTDNTGVDTSDLITMSFPYRRRPLDAGSNEGLAGTLGNTIPQGISDPALHCLGGVTRLSIEANPGCRRMLMDNVQKFLKEYEMLGDCSHAGTDQEAIIAFPVEMSRTGRATPKGTSRLLRSLARRRRLGPSG